MSEDEEIKRYAFYKKNENDKVWWLDNYDVRGQHIFSFDKVHTFNLFRDYPYKLTKEQKAIFDKENPFWAEMFANRVTEESSSDAE